MKNGVYQLEIELALLRICEGIRDGVEGGGRGKKKKLLVTTAASTRGNRNEPVQVRNLGSGSVRQKHRKLAEGNGGKSDRLTAGCPANHRLVDPEQNELLVLRPAAKAAGDAERTGAS